ncbi:MAG: acetylornithine deacetylase [Pyrinomonadaceae bacterium]|nr:acetylornithine deacetylase [Pyrinomonadaceae bacterium]
MTVERTLRELVGFNSISSLPNEEIISYTVKRAEKRGLRVRFFPYRDEHGIEKLNMVAVAPNVSSDETEIELALVGHTDVVPFDPAWTEALTLTERDGKLYGRGACDTKGFIAAALTAIEETDIKKLRRPLALVFTADEEVGCVGAKHLAEAKAFRARYAIVGEPTSLQPMRAGKGYCLAEIVLHGREGHSAHPERGASAILHAARFIRRIEEISEQLKTEIHPAFDPPHTTINIGMIQGGTAKNVIAGSCRFTLEWRPVPNQTAEHTLDMVARAAEQLHQEDANFDCEINAGRIDAGVETDPNSPLVCALEEATGKPAGTVAFGTEAPQLTELGAQAVVFGPGDIRTAHRTGEFVPVAALRSCVSVLKNMIERFCM